MGALRRYDIRVALHPEVSVSIDVPRDFEGGFFTVSVGTPWEGEPASTRPLTRVDWDSIRLVEVGDTPRPPGP